MRKIFLFISLICVFIFADMFVLEPNLLIVKNKKLYLPHWDESLSGFKVGVVSDLHIGTKYVDLKKVEQVANKLNANNPDLVVLLGDLDAKTIQDGGYTTDEVAQSLKLFKGKYGVISILGNHDYEPAGVINSIHQKAGIPLLEHQDKFITLNGQTIRIVGFKDLWHFKSVPVNVIGTKYKTTPTIVLAHNPDSFADMPDFVSLTLSGHNHGGEVIFPIVGSFTVPSKYGQRYRKGYIVENNKHLYVSGGVASLSRVRFMNPPEISVLTLYPQTDKNRIANTKPLKGIAKNYAPLVIDIIRNFTKKINAGKK